MYIYYLCFVVFFIVFCYNKSTLIEGELLMESIKKLYERFPVLKEKDKRPNDPKISLTTQEAVFYQLLRFFQEPKVNQFSVNMLYEHLLDEDLLFAMELMITFFQKDTTHVKNVSQNFYELSLLREPIVNQKAFSSMVEEAIEGMKFRPSMLYMFWQRRSDKIPRPDLIIEGTPYWKKSAVEDFILKEKKKRKKESAAKQKETTNKKKS